MTWLEELAESHADNIDYLDSHVTIAGRDSDRKSKADAASDSIIYFHAAGAGFLLLENNVEKFFDSLTRSALARLEMLKLYHEGTDISQKVLKASNLRGLHAAIVAGEWSLAKAIAEKSVSENFERVEYLDDFLIAFFLHRYVTGAATDELQDVFNRLDESLGSDESPQRDLCHTLLDQDMKLAKTAFSRLITKQQAYIEEMKDHAIGEDSIFLPLSKVYVEGLAWLKLLDRAGIALDDEYPMCPSSARVSRSETPAVLAIKFYKE